MTRSIYYCLLLLLTGALLAGCSSTRIVTSWHDESVPSGTIKKPLVLALANKQVIRARLEDELVRALRASGVDAMQSYRVFPDLNAATPETIKDRLPELDRDSVLVTRLTDVKTETVNVPAQTTVYPGGGYAVPAHYDRFGSYYAHSYSVVSSPASSYEFKIYALETNLYDARNEKLVWTAATETDDTTSVDSAISDIVKVVMENIKQSRLF